MPRTLEGVRAVEVFFRAGLLGASALLGVLVLRTGHQVGCG